MEGFNSRLISLQEVVNEDIFFNIPIYQRLYVWGSDQIKTLLDDLWQAYSEKQEVFFLGGTLAIERDVEGEKVLDLIDGQQRFTTLWLASLQWGGGLNDFCFKEVDNAKKHRIGFSIRPEVSEYFQQRVDGKKPVDIPQVSQMLEALAVLEHYPSNIENTPDWATFAGFIEFIKTHVKLVLTTVPPQTDLNKLFEVINNRGVQLQHHEILKARLLHFIDVSEREAYSRLWEACAGMNDYVEKNLKKACNADVLSLYENKESLSQAKSVLVSVQNDSAEVEPISLADILKEESINLDDKSSAFDEDEMPSNVGSIISFSMLLQHTLRIFLVRNGREDISKVSDKHLIKICENAWLKTEKSTKEPNADEVKAFIELLWEVRYQFDKHVVKWVFDDEVKYHSIRLFTINSSKENRYLQRRTDDSQQSLALLQSMLYHSQELVTQYWLTPFLNYLVNNPVEPNTEAYLRHLDNHLLSSEMSDALPLIQRTEKFLKDPEHRENLIEAEVALNQKFENGVQYPHYWFYKLEYVLFLYLKAQNVQHEWIKNFRITAKSSVEHIAPQSSFSKVEDFPLHDFGNLALVTRSLNSEFSDKSYGEKREQFKHNHNNKGVSLKLEYVYQNEKWTPIEIKQHQHKMIDIMQTYLDQRNDI